MAKRLIKSINIMSASGDTQGIERIDSQIKALILSMVGTIPGSRGLFQPSTGDSDSKESSFQDLRRRH